VRRRPELSVGIEDVSALDSANVTALSDDDPEVARVLHRNELMLEGDDEIDWAAGYSALEVIDQHAAVSARAAKRWAGGPAKSSSGSRKWRTASRLSGSGHGTRGTNTRHYTALEHLVDRQVPQRGDVERLADRPRLVAPSAKTQTVTSSVSRYSQESAMPARAAGSGTRRRDQARRRRTVMGLIARLFALGPGGS
jgi:hypothetical protein